MDTKIITVSVFLLVFSICSTLVNGSEIEFTSSKSSIQPILTSRLTLKCDLHDTTPLVSERTNERKDVADSPSVLTHSKSDSSLDSHTETQDSQADCDHVTDRREGLTNTAVNVDFVTSIVISKDGVDVATLSVHFPAKSLVDTTDVRVNGSLSGQRSETKGHLEVTFDHPTVNQVGTYRCEVYGIDSQGHTYHFSKTVEIVEEEITWGELVKHVKNFEKTVENLTQTNQVMNQTIKEMNQTIKVMIQTVAKTHEANATMNKPIKDQAKEILDLRQTIDNMASQVNISLTRIFFSAGLTTSLHPTNGQVINFNRVWSNIGGAYSTGVFTCPLSGYYSFIVSVQTENRKQAYLMLQHNNRDVYQIFSFSDQGWQSATNSAIIKLDKHDTVRVVSPRSGSYIFSQTAELATTFSGQLVAVV